MNQVRKPYRGGFAPSFGSTYLLSLTLLHSSGQSSSAQYSVSGGNLNALLDDVYNAVDDFVVQSVYSLGLPSSIAGGPIFNPYTEEVKTFFLVQLLRNKTGVHHLYRY